MVKKKKVKKTTKKKKPTKKAVKKKVVKKKKPAKKKLAKKKKVAKKKPAKKKLAKKKKPAKKKLLKKVVKKLVKKAVPKKVPVKSLKKIQAALQAQIKKEAAPKKEKVKKIRVSAKFILRESELKDLLAKEQENTTILKDVEGRDYCLVEKCDSHAVIEGYCRLHYFAGWKLILQRKQLLEEKFLEKIITELVEKYTPSIVEYMLKDVGSEKSFSSAMKKLEEEGDVDMEDENLIYLLN